MYACVWNAIYWWSDFFIFYLQELYLRENKIDFIHPLAFKGLKTLYRLDISNNRLTSAPSLRDVKGTLRELNFEYNYIKYVKDTYFDFCMNIKCIRISFNKLTQFPSLQTIVKTIVVFEVAGNSISNANFIYGNRFPKLQILNLEYNQIGEFCPPPRIFVPKLHTILLPGNKLSKIHFPLESYGREMKIYLKNNPWHCNGSLGWTQQCEMEEGTRIMVCMDWFFLRGMVCDSPVETQGLTPKEAGKFDTCIRLIRRRQWGDHIKRISGL